jgi:type VI secretion system protein ImpG
MDRRFLEKYNDELLHLRSAAGEFAQEFPKIAGRLALDSFECADPYVERLLEGFAFLTARIQLKFDAEFPRFTQSILETVYPHYLAPTPSMAVIEFEPDYKDDSLAAGVVIPRETSLNSIIGVDDRTSCEYRTSADAVLWPIRITQAEYITRELASLKVPQGAKAALRLRMEATAGLSFNAIKASALRFFLRGNGSTCMDVYEQIYAQCCGVALIPADQPGGKPLMLPPNSVVQRGFAKEESLIPYGGESFQGYRLLQEYFSFPARYMFFEIANLAAAFKASAVRKMDLLILFKQENLDIEGRVDESMFKLACAPAINLFPKRTDRIHIDESRSEWHVVADRTRPLDFEIYKVVSVNGYGIKADDVQPFTPFYTATDLEQQTAGSGAYFTTRREPRMVSDKEKRRGRRSSYGGSEVYISLVDSKSAPYSSELRQLGLQTLCTNRDLPLQMPVDRAGNAFTMAVNAPVSTIRIVAGPTAPRPSVAEGEMAWRAISHLSLNYLSLVDSADGQGAQALRDLLKLYSGSQDAQIRKQIEGLHSVSTRRITRRIPSPGPVTFARGLEITVTFDEDSFEGGGIFLLGSVLSQFFTRYVSINSFTETVIHSKQRGEVMRWPASLGTLHIL